MEEGGVSHKTFENAGRKIIRKKESILKEYTMNLILKREMIVVSEEDLKNYC